MVSAASDSMVRTAPARSAQKVESSECLANCQQQSAELRMHAAAMQEQS
jgi:hypothetical protein